MPNAAFNRGRRPATSPIKISKPFAMKLGPSKKVAIYGFGKLSSLSAKISPTFPKPYFLSGKSFGRLSILYSSEITRPRPLGTSSPVSLASFKAYLNKSGSV